MKQMRREVADLLRANKQENARIRVEAVMREQNMLQVCVPVVPLLLRPPTAWPAQMLAALLRAHSTAWTRKILYGCAGL